MFENENLMRQKRIKKGSREQKAERKEALRQRSSSNRFKCSRSEGLNTLASCVATRSSPVRKETSPSNQIAESTNKKYGTRHVRKRIGFLATTVSAPSSSSSSSSSSKNYIIGGGSHSGGSSSSSSNSKITGGNKSDRRMSLTPGSSSSGNADDDEEANNDYDWDFGKREGDGDEQREDDLPKHWRHTQKRENGKEKEPPKIGLLQGSPKFVDSDSDMEWTWSDKEDSCSSEESGVAASEWKEDADMRAMKTMWRRCCKRMNPDLLVRNHESRMECEHLSARKAGEPGYAALPVNERNNCDLRRIYDVRYAPAKGRGHPIAAYANVKSTFGQFSRLCVCLQLLDIKDVWKPGAIFRHALSKDAVFSLIAYFRLRGQATTVSNKAANLKMVVEHAGLAFATDVELRAKSDELRISLDRARSAERREMRNIARNTKEEREAAGKLLVEGDMDVFAERAYAACRGILKSAKECKPATELFLSRPSGPTLINKWCINLLSYLMMVGNGQRPQVYRLLILPTPEQMRSWVEDADKEVSLRTLLEKTPRSMECPAVLFPRRLASLLRFHVLVVRPLILERLKIDEKGDRAEYPLLIQGVPLYIYI